MKTSTRILWIPHRLTYNYRYLLKKIKKLKKEGSTIQFDRSVEFIKDTSNKNL